MMIVDTLGVVEESAGGYRCNKEMFIATERSSGIGFERKFAMTSIEIGIMEYSLLMGYDHSTEMLSQIFLGLNLRTLQSSGHGPASC
jgi:hypothetical protein